MRFSSTTLNDILVFEPKVFGDARGAFFESWNYKVFSELGITANFVQDNHSTSVQGTLRGLHFQHPHPQGKLVWVIEGEVFDVAVDLRQKSRTFGKWEGFILSAENRKRVWIPPGFAHGFYATSHRAQFCYKCSDYYHPDCEKTLAWNDPSLAIDWPIAPGSSPLLSAKDSQGLTFHQCSGLF
jgi:dTDP-4-dehydrorhamnose 3,5-epimerase